MPDKDQHPAHIEDCMICQKHRGEIVVQGGAIHSDRVLYIGHASKPANQNDSYPGILVIEPRRHIPGPEDLSNQEAQAIGTQIARLSKALIACTDAEHVYIFRLGHHVPHLHIFLVPRYPGTPREYWGVRVDEWPDGPRATPQEVEDLCDRIRSFLIDQA
jgi:diadenosine tetraphosphate (Ap4A) HIT family hydrolase